MLTACNGKIEISNSPARTGALPTFLFIKKSDISGTSVSFIAESVS